MSKRFVARDFWAGHTTAYKIEGPIGYDYEVHEC